MTPTTARSTAGRPRTIPCIDPIEANEAAGWLKYRVGPPEAQIRAESRPLRLVIDRTAAWPSRPRTYARWAAVRAFSGPTVVSYTDWGTFVTTRHDLGFLHPVFAEPFETAVVHRLVRPGMTVIDVGANRGWFTVLTSSLVGPTGTVIAVEPNARARAALVANVARNVHGSNVTVLDCALGDRVAPTRFVPEEGTEISHLAREDEAGESVEMRTLSSLGVDPDFVKIDVEGAEEMVVRGLGDARPALLVECNREHQALYGSSPEAVVAQLDNYVTVRLCWDHGRPEAPEVACAHAPNMLCVPAEDAVLLEQLFA